MYAEHDYYRLTQDGMNAIRNCQQQLEHHESCTKSWMFESVKSLVSEDQDLAMTTFLCNELHSEVPETEACRSCKREHKRLMTHLSSSDQCQEFYPAFEVMRENRRIRGQRRKSKKYHVANVEARKGQMKAYEEKNKDYRKGQKRSWEEANIELRKEQKRSWEEANIELRKEQKRSWEEANIENRKEQKTSWRNKMLRTEKLKRKPTMKKSEMTIWNE